MMITISLIVIYNELMILIFLKNLKFLQGVSIENVPKNGNFESFENELNFDAQLN